MYFYQSGRAVAFNVLITFIFFHEIRSFVI